LSKTAILIVNASAPGHKIRWLDLCLPQIERHSRSSDYQIYIANGDSEAEGRYIAATYPKVKVFSYRTEKRGAEQHSAGLDFLIERLDKEIEYFVTLDSDAFPIRDRWLEILTSFIETGATAVGVYRDEFVSRFEPFVHVSCLCMRKQDYYNLGIRFADGQKPGRDFSYYANCEWLKRNASLVGLRRSNVNNYHFLIGGIYGNLIYHHGAGSRPPAFITSTARAQNEAVWKNLRGDAFTNLDELITGLIDCPYDAIETLPIPTVRVKQQNMNLALINRDWQKYSQSLENTGQPKTEFTCGKGVFILGMHRSGTSCLTGMLEQYGLHLGEVYTSSQFNQKGNRESEVAMQINNELLLASGSYWYEPEEVQWVPPPLKERIEQFKQNLGVGKLWGIKDPRMLFCLSAWFQPDTLLVGTFRHPYDVIYSLKDRENIVLPGRDWQELWFRYNCQLISLYHLCPFPIINFDWEANRYRAAVQNLGRSLSLNIEREDFFDPELRHHRCGEEIQDPRARKLYSELVEIAECEEKKLQEVSKRAARLQIIKLELERSRSRLSQIKAFLE
jgi:hypothetical protein